MSEEIPQVKYSSYTPAQKRASQLYRQKNKEKINEQRKKYYLSRKERDPKFLEYKRVKAKEYYEKKKLDKVVIPDVKPDVEMVCVKNEDISEEVKSDTPDVVMKPMDASIKEPKQKKEKKVKVVEPSVEEGVPTVEPSIEPVKKSRKQKKA